MTPRPQKGKNRSRPRGWHRGRAAGHAQAKDLLRLQEAERRGAELEAEVAAARVALSEETALWTALRHVSPAAPAWAGLPDLIGPERSEGPYLARSVQSLENVGGGLSQDTPHTHPANRGFLGLWPWLRSRLRAERAQLVPGESEVRPSAGRSRKAPGRAVELEVSPSP